MTNLIALTLSVGLVGLGWLLYFLKRLYWLGIALGCCGVTIITSILVG
jgi:hypothetical protein